MLQMPPPQIKDESFDTLFVSPLTRARETADIIAAAAGLTPHVLPALREIDLYSFQVQGRRAPAAFTLLSHCDK